MESGNLAQKAVLPLLAELHQQQATGSLKLERAPLQKAVYFREGQILFAASNDPKDQLASILVEEGKLGPDQMQVAQARVSPGNPLAKVLTELGYISQRELADAARLKVEKILTDLFGWKEGTYTFAEKSLPKGAIDLELSTPRLLFNSIRRMQDREWVLQELGSLDAVLAPSGTLGAFLTETDADDQAREVLNLADGVKTVKQIGSGSSLGEFEVCKLLAGAELLGALQKGAGAAPPAGKEEVLFVSEGDSVPESTQAEPLDQTILDTGGGPFQGMGVEPEPAANLASPPQLFADDPPPPPPFENGIASDLLIDDPEAESAGEEPMGRVPPRPRGRGGDSGGGNLKKILIAVAAVVLLTGGGYAGYTFIWPLLAGSGGEPSGGSGKATSTAAQKGQPQGKGSTKNAPSGPTAAGAATSQSPPGATPPSGPTSQPGKNTATGPTPTAGQSTGQSTPPSTQPPKTSPPKTSPPKTSPPKTSPPKTSPPKTSAGQKNSPPRTKQPKATPQTTGTPTNPGPGTTPQPPLPPTSSSLSTNHELLTSGNINDAAAGYLQHLRSNAPDKFTIAVGVYCDSANVSRAFRNSGNSDRLIVLPYRYNGRSCYRVFWGLFDSREAALNGVSSLPAAIRAPESAPVSTFKLIR